MAVFTQREREQLRAQIVSIARSDSRIAGAAHIGSAAAERLDRWSDIDLAFCLAPDASLDDVVSDWSNRFYGDYGAAAHHDLRYGKTLYRVFLLKSTLQVDLSFWPPGEFAAIGPDFKLIFGQSTSPSSIPAVPASELIGMAWLYALHARSSILRNRFWQAEYMVSGMRDHVLALACIRYHLTPHQGRAIDDLPLNVNGPLTECLVRSLEPGELKRSFSLTTQALLNEIEANDAELAQRLAEPLNTMVESTC